jgi:hypothetical protein
MAQYQYTVVPFIGKIKGGQSAGEVAAQLQALIDQHSAQGWELQQVTDVNIEVQPGCLGGLLGAKVAYIRFDQVIFRREIPSA